MSENSLNSNPLALRDVNNECDLKNGMSKEDASHIKEKNSDQHSSRSSGNLEVSLQDARVQTKSSQIVQTENSLNNHINFPCSIAENIKSNTLLHVTVLDGQVIYLTYRPVADRDKLNVLGKSKCIEAGKTRNISEFSEKPCEKSQIYLTANKSYILPNGVAAEGEYLLAEEVPCEDVFHSPRIVHEEQVLTIHHPSSFDINTRSQPDALAIAASEVLSDVCLTSPCQDNSKCQHSSCLQDCTPEKEQNNEEKYEEDVSKTHSSGSSKSLCKANISTALKCNPESEIFLEKLENVLTSPKNRGKEEQVANFKNSKIQNTLKSDVSLISNESICAPLTCLIQSTSSVEVNSQSTSLSEVASHDESTARLTILTAVETDNTPTKTNGCVSTNPVESFCQSVDSEVTTLTTKHSNLRRSNRIVKVKKGLTPLESTSLEEPSRQERRQAVKRASKRAALWDCVKCDAMFRSKASRDRHMLEGHVFTCYMCKWQGLTKTKYEVHISTVHCGQKARCFPCRKDFPNYGEYKAHLEDKHCSATFSSDNFDDSASLRLSGEENHPHDSHEFCNTNPIKTEDADDSGYKETKDILENKNSNAVESKRNTTKNVSLDLCQKDKKSECPYCGKRIGHLSHFMRHLNYHIGNKAFVCKICGKPFVEKSGLESHLLSHNPINKPCLQCGKVFKTHRTMKRHLRTHQRTQYVCDICHKVFHHDESFRVHKSLHKEGGSGNVCVVCEKDCRTPYYLHLHMTTKHESPKFFCTMCNRSFKWRQSYKKHMVTHSESSDSTMKFKCTICHLRFSSLTDLNIHKVTHNEEKKFTCDVCGSSFRREYARDKHVKIVHREELEHMCSQCGALFKAKAYLDQHLTHVHTTKERVKCLTCGRDFKTTSILKSHIKLVHNAACHKYSCQLCQKTFAAPKDLARHNKVHTGVKDHMCPICRRCFARKDNMASHLRTHARDSTPSQTTITETLDTSSQPNIQETSEILSMPPALPSTSDMSTSSDFQSETSSCNGLKSGDSVISGGIDISTLPIPNISLPSSISGSSSNSPACIVIPSKPSTSLPVVVFSGGTLSNPSDNLILSSPNHTLTDVPFSNMHSTLNGFTVSQPSASFTNLSSSATTLTYCNNVNISLTRTTTSSHICAVDKSTVEEDNLGNHHVVTFQSYDPSLSNQTSSLTPLPQLSLNSVTPVSSQPCTDSTDPIVSAGSAFNTLSTEQIVLTGGVLSPTGAISYHHQSNPQYTQVIES